MCLINHTSNSLATLPEGTHPRTRIVGPKIAHMEERLVDLDTVIVKLASVHVFANAHLR
jgi:hypothetical protein